MQRYLLAISLRMSWLLGLWLAVVTPFSGLSQSDQAIYTDSLQPTWANWSWGSTIDFGNTAVAHSGTKSVSVTLTSAWGAIYLEHPAFNSSPYASLTFWIHGGVAGGQRLQVQALTNGVVPNGVSFTLPALQANVWQQFSISLGSLEVANKPNMDGFWIQDRTGGPQPAFYLDDITLTANSTTSPTVTLTSPAEASTFGAPATINIAADVVPNGHTITKIQFLGGATLLSEDVLAPYSFTWTNVGLGTYSLIARVIYDVGASVDSQPVNVTVMGTASVSISIDPQANRRPISPLIYGVAFADTSSQLSELNCPVHRSGGNAETRYNWQLNAHNRGADWYFESIDDGSSTPAGSADSFVSKSKTGGAEPMLTIPMIGWVPKLGPGRGKLASYSIAKYGPQTGSDWQWFPDAGNGISSANNQPITTNDPNDANFSTNSAYQEALLQHLTNRWGPSTQGGVRYYLMDNEHSLWHSTHQDVHPAGARMAEIRDRVFEYAGKVKSLDPSALVLAPEEWGWSGYFYSGYDQQYGSQHGWGNLPDRVANGNMDYMPWLLSQLHQRATNTNQRLVDYFTLHCYPQGGEFSATDVSTSMQLLRNRSTRQLWDTNYVDPTWINAPVMLIPRMKGWVTTYYPGTKIGVTEYNWGAEGHINGATAQADIYGIFGREGLDIATRWTCPPASTPTFKAMKLFRNYDGNRSGFGETSVRASGPNPDNVSVFAAVRNSDGALTLMAINKQLHAAAMCSVAVTNCLLRGTGEVWQLTAANVINRLADLTFAGNSFTSTLPAQSITLFVLPAGTPPPPALRPGAVNGGNTLELWLEGVAGQRYVVESTTDLVAWSPVATNSITGNSWRLDVTLTNAPYRLYRAYWVP